MKLLFILMTALMLPIVPALACFPQQQEEEILFASEGRNFDRSPIPMSYCESGEVGFVVVEGKCYDFDAITDYNTEEECQADEICNAYREQQKQQEEREPKYDSCGCRTDIPGYDCPQMDCGDPIQTQPIPKEPVDDQNHGEIKGDEELTDNPFGDKDRLQDEEEHEEEEEQTEEKSQETTGETSE